jgi:hypothetical protein
MNWLAVAVAASVFNTIFIFLLVTRPREVYDSERNIDYFKLLWFTLIVFGIIVAMFFLVKMFSWTNL